MRRFAALAAAAALALPGAVVGATLAVALDAARPAAAHAVDDGLAPTPPMGFNDWNAFGCNVTEELITQTADLFVSAGLKDAGYRYVNIDDCWMLRQRGGDGRLVPDPVKFPHGLAWLADYVHGKGLKLGIYEDAGTQTCAGFPGSLGHEEVDAQSFAAWGIDYLKYDNCFNGGDTTKEQYIRRYTAMRDALAKTGRPIVYSICEWGTTQPWTWAPAVGQLWRTTGDIFDNWESVKSIARQNLPLHPFAKPGAWNDPDMLQVGNGGMTDTEYRTHFGLWAMMNAPLLIGTDLRRATPQTWDILRNAEVIALNQDRLGRQAAPVTDSGGHVVLAKPLANGDVAVALYNETDVPARISTTARAVNLKRSTGYALRDVWGHRVTQTAGTIAATVPAHGTVIYRVSPTRDWAKLPPSTDVSATLPGAAQVAGKLLMLPGKATGVQTAFGNQGRLPVRDAAVTLTAPAGWAVEVTSAPVAGVVGTDRQLRTQWTVTAPAGTPAWTYDLTATAVYRWGARNWETTTGGVSVLVAYPPAAGTSFLSDLTWLSAKNAWGPVEKDRSNGEQPAGDGQPITINGVAYAKGLGTNAPSEIVYYVAGACSTVTTDVGIDDEKAANANATFQIWADGTKVADSGPLTFDDPAKPLTASITGATLVRLVVTDNGTPDSDHADWANTKITC
jgi:alpha-galactosidase